MTADQGAQDQDASSTDETRSPNQTGAARILIWLKAPLHMGITAAIVFVIAVAAYFLITRQSSPPRHHHETNSVQAKGPVAHLPDRLSFRIAAGWKVITYKDGGSDILLTHTNPRGLLSVNYTAGNLVSVKAALLADVPRFLGPDASALRTIHVIATNRSIFDQLAQVGFDFLSSSGNVLTHNGEAIELLSTQTGQRVLITFIPPNLATLKALTPGVNEMIFSLAEN